MEDFNIAAATSRDRDRDATRQKRAVTAGLRFSKLAEDTAVVVTAVAASAPVPPRAYQRGSADAERRADKVRHANAIHVTAAKEANHRSEESFWAGSGNGSEPLLSPSPPPLPLPLCSQVVADGRPFVVPTASSSATRARFGATPSHFSPPGQ